MKRAALIAIVSLAAFAACSAQEREAAPQPIAAEEAEPFSVLSFQNGTVVIHRSGESSLSSTPVHAIDGTTATSWSAPPGDLRQSAVFEFAVPISIEAVGLSHGEPSSPSSMLKTAIFESSVDGVAFTPLTTFAAKRIGRETESVPPREVRYLRVTTAESFSSQSALFAPEIRAEGRELAPFERPALVGEWMFDALPARFTQSGGRVTGSVDTLGPLPLRLDGGWEGRHVRFLWTRGAEYGYATVTVSADGTRLSGFSWYEEVFPQFNRSAWFGQKDGKEFVPLPPPEPVPNGTALIGRTEPVALPPPSASPDEPVVEAFYRRFGRVPLYQITFDDGDQVDVLASAEGFSILKRLLEPTPARAAVLTVYELREPSTEANLARSQKRADSLRAALASAGIDPARLEVRAAGSVDPSKHTGLPMQKLMYSRVELSDSGR